jgi:hypothetical protein
VQNTILADNIQYNSPTQEPNDCHGQVKSSGYSLIEVPGALCSLDSGPGDIVGVDPQLNALAGNQTEWHKIPLTSPAVEKANPNGCADANGVLLEEDQRGYNRHVEADGDGIAQCDIGAYENGDAISPNP